MSSTQQGSSGQSRRVGKAAVQRRTWSAREEEVLIAAIRELIAQGWKSDNGFRAGYLSRLEEAMRREFPTSDLKGNPHINSKIQAWKKTYYSLSNILSRSGVGFNARGNYMLDVEDDTWEIILKIDPNARTMRFKQWPYYETWSEIFGRDRATGEAAEDLLEAVNDLAGEASSQHGPAERNFEPGGDQIPTEDDADTSRSHSLRHGASTSSREKKRKLSRDVQEVCNVLQMIGRSADMRLDNLAGKFGYDFALEQKKTEACEMIERMDGLSKRQRFAVSELLSREADKLQVFRSLSDARKVSYVHHLVHNLNL